MKINKIKGTSDLYGDKMAKYRYVEKIAFETAKLFGYEEMQTPVFEATEVFSRGVGEGSDIVNKEMYTFLDRSEKSLTLRPEGTAGLSRAYVENKLYVEPGIKKYCYFEQMFRAERPQAGRYRQFTQFGVEALGNGSPYLDADVIYLGKTILENLGIKKYKLLINSIGSINSRTSYEKALKEHFEKHIDTMCDDCKVRLLKNPLRILDCKVDKQHQAMLSSPKIKDYLCEEDKKYFEDVLKTLDYLNVSYEIDYNLVRGLDYYNNTVFEFICDDEKSDIYGMAILAGGRYNGLSACFDGPVEGAIGFGMGADRIMYMLDEDENFPKYQKEVDFCILSIGEENKIHALGLANFLRCSNAKFSVELDYVAANLKPQFKLSERVNAKNLIIIGSDEVENNTLKLKNIATQEENIITLKVI